MVLVEKITVNAGTNTLTVGESTSVCATISPNNATNKNVRWESSNEKVAVVEGNTITAYQAGTAVIKAISKDTSGQYGSLTITVKAPAPIGVSSISLNRAALNLEEGEGYGLVATVSPSSAANKDIEWSSSNPSVASVDINGYVCAKEKGTAVILATSEDNCNAKVCCTVTVTGDTLVTSVSVNPYNVTLQVGANPVFNAIVCPPGATNKKVTWCSSKPSVASVHSDTGKVYANNIGTAKIYATATDGTEKFGYCTVTVTPIYTQKLTASKSEMTIHKGEYAYPPQIIRTPAEPTDPSLYWCSDNDDIVEVNCQDGCLYAKNVGTARIYVTAKDGSNKRTYFTVKVEPPVVISVKEIVLSCDKKTIIKGEQERITATIKPSKVTEDYKISWTSSDNSIATVDQHGYVTGVNIGKVTITASVNNQIKDQITLAVVLQDVYLIKGTDGFNTIVFEGNDSYQRKEWQCINYDMINDPDNKQGSLTYRDYYSQLIRRDAFNTYENNINEYGQLEGVTQYKEYTPNEQKLLYFLDPLGFAKYVQNYSYKYSDLTQKIEYKERIFKLLFNDRSPRRYQRRDVGDWYETTDVNINWSETLSEAEFIFGMHSLWDKTSIKELVDLGFKILDTLLPATAISDVYNMCCAITDIFENGPTQYVVNEITSKGEEKFLDAFGMGWVGDMISLGGSFGDVAEAFGDLPAVAKQTYKLMFDYCTYESNYGVFVRIGDKKYELMEFVE